MPPDDETGVDAPAADAATKSGNNVPKGSLEERLAALEADNKRLRDHNRDIVEKRTKIAGRANELQERLAKYEADEEARKTNEAKKAQRFDKLESDYKQKLADLAKAKADAEARVEAMERNNRRSQLLDRVAGRVQADRGILDAMLLTMERDGFEAGPELVDDAVVDAAIEQIKSRAPSLFETRGVGGTPGLPNGRSMTEDAAKDKRIDDLATKYSTMYRSSNGRG